MSTREVKPKDLLKVLLKLGFTIRRQRGSHVFIEKFGNGKPVFTSISIHNKPLPKGTLRAILKQTGVSEAELRDNLR